MKFFESDQCEIANTIYSKKDLTGNIGALRDSYDALRAKGVNHKVATVNLARRIAAVTLSCLKNNEVYHDDYRERLKTRKRTRQMLNGK